MRINSLHSLLLIPLAALLYSCANMGTPQGGPRDEDPPRFVSSTPAPDAVNFQGSELVLTFNELVNVKDAFSKVTVSPPGGGAPRVTSSGRRIYVRFPDTLRSNTTYTVDFGNSIEDNNEANKLSNLAVSFSTGNELDSLRISGVLLDAYTLEPQQFTVVGVHPADAPDSAFTTLPLHRATRTDDRGRFTLRGLKPIPYRLYALADANNDFRRDNPAEAMAFYPSPITPFCERSITTDTTYNVALSKVDTVVEREYTRFLPNDLLLSLFDEGYKPQYLVKYERPDSARIRFIFNAPATALPALKVLNIPDAPAYRIEHTASLDTLDYWLTDPRFVRADTLQLSLAYTATDAKRLSSLRTDTLTLTKPKVKPRKGKRSRKQIEADSIEDARNRLIGVTIRPSGTLHVYQQPSLEFSEPLFSLDSAALHLEMKQDSLWLPSQFLSITPDSTSAMRKWVLGMEPEPGATYRVRVDSLAARSISGRFNPSATQEFTVKKREDYVALTLRLVPDTIAGFVEVLNGSDNVVQRATVSHGVASFPWLAPADYYARFVADADSSGTFTPGSYELRRQPEDTFYYPGLISLKRHDRSEQWNLFATPVDAQKPRRLVKNKPDSDKKRRTEDPEESTEEDDTFDVNSNPFAPSSGSLRPR